MNTMNHYVQLEQEEQELLDSYERDEWQSVADFQERLRQYQAYAITAFEAVGLVGVPLSQEDIQAIRAKAAATGIPYQTFIANIVHKYVAGELVEKPRTA